MFFSGAPATSLIFLFSLYFFRGTGNTLAIGTHSAEIQLWDVSANTMMRTMQVSKV